MLALRPNFVTAMIFVQMSRLLKQQQKYNRILSGVDIFQGVTPLIITYKLIQNLKIPIRVLRKIIWSAPTLD